MQIGARREMANYEIDEVPGGELSAFSGAEKVSVLDDNGVTRWVLASSLKTYVNTNPVQVLSGDPQSYMRLTKSGDQALAADTQEVLTWASADVDTEALFSIGQPTRGLAKSNATLVRVSCGVAVDNPSNGRVHVEILKNGVAFPGMPSERATSNSAPTYVSLISGPISCSPGDYFEVVVSCSSAVDVVDDDRTWFAVEVVEQS